MYTSYRRFCKAGAFKIGQLYLYRTANKWVLNFPTKEHWRKPSRLEWIESGLQKFVATYTEQGITSISFPQLGCGNGGLPWSDVRPLVEKYLGTLPIPVYVHVRAGDADFVPEHLSQAAVKKLQRHRERIGFQMFFEDFLRVVGEEASLPAALMESDADEPKPLPTVTLKQNGTVVSVRGEDLEDFWNDLAVRGAVPVHDYPGSLRRAAELVTDVLLKIDYLEPMSFVASEGESERGVRFAPAPALRSPRPQRATQLK